VELIFAESPELDLPELVVHYALRRSSGAAGAAAASECLLAQDVHLPDGLAQEYSPTVKAPDGGSTLAAERLPLIARMLADAASLPTSSTTPVACEARQGQLTWPAAADSDDDVREGAAPVGIIKESDSDGSDADWPLHCGSSERLPGRAGAAEAGCAAAPEEAASGDAERLARGSSNSANKNEASHEAPIEEADVVEGAEEYCDDFEGESDGSSRGPGPGSSQEG